MSLTHESVVIDDPEPLSWTKARSHLARLHRQGSDAGPDEIDEARTELRAARADQFIRSLVDDAPPLSPAQRARLAAILLSGT